MRIDIEREAFLRVSQLRGQLGHGDAFTELDRGVSVAQIVRVKVRDAGRLAGTLQTEAALLEEALARFTPTDALRDGWALYAEETSIRLPH